MLAICIKYFFIILYGFYLYSKLLNLNTTKQTLFIEIISSQLLAIIIYFVRLHFSPGSILVLVILFTSIAYLLYKQSANVTVVSSIISVGCSYTLFVLATFLLSPLSLLLTQKIANNTILYIFSLILIGFLQLIFAMIPFRFSRLKSGMPFLIKQESTDIGIFIAILLLIATSFFNMTLNDDPYLLLPLFFVTLSGILIFFWWKNKLTESYILKIKEREINDLQDEINELKEYNKTLDKIIHKDNKLVPTMELSVRTTLNQLNERSSPEDQKRLTNLLIQLEDMAKDREGILKFSSHQSTSSVSTGVPAIDNLLFYLSARAYSQQIRLEVVVAQTLHTIIPASISETDLRTLIADLVENAFIAVKNETHPHVLLQFRQEENKFIIEFFDNGIPFTQEVLEKLGKEPITTHKDENGTGIGYMTTFEILRRCKATFDIDENLSIESFKKKITVQFQL